MSDHPYVACPDGGCQLPANHAASPTPDKETQVPSDLPAQVVVGANGAYWRDYGTHYSMCPVSDDNDPVEVVAVFKRYDASDTSWDRGFAAGLASAPAAAPVAEERLDVTCTCDFGPHFADCPFASEPGTGEPS